jgi:hypothetical protein
MNIDRTTKKLYIPNTKYQIQIAYKWGIRLTRASGP